MMLLEFLAQGQKYVHTHNTCVRRVETKTKTKKIANLRLAV